MKENKKNSKKLLTFIWRFVRIQKWKFFFIYIFSLVWSLDATLGPYLLRRIIDIFAQYDIDRAAAWLVLKWLLMGMMALWVAVEAGSRSRDFLQARAYPKLEADIRMAMFDHIQRHSPKYFNEHFAGSLSNKISDMTTQVRAVLQNINIFIPGLGTCILSMIFFYKINPMLAIFLVGWIIINLTIGVIFNKKGVAYSKIYGEATSILNGKVVDSFTNNFAVNLFCRFQFEKDQIAFYQSDQMAKNHQAQYCVARMFLCLSVVPSLTPGGHF